VNDKFYESIYGEPKISPVKAVRGKLHEYLEMTQDYSTKGVLDMLSKGVPKIESGYHEVTSG
jgi:hypothetical protein